MTTVMPRADQRDREHRDLLEDIRRGTGDLADALGMPEDGMFSSISTAGSQQVTLEVYVGDKVDHSRERILRSLLGQGTHKRLVGQVQRLAVMDAMLEAKVTAVTRALKTPVADITIHQGDTADATEVDSMAIILEQLKAKVSSSMLGAEDKAVQTRAYKDVMKKISDPQDGDDDIVMTSSETVSLICPITAVKIVNPVRSKICRHTYGRDAIRSHIKVSKKHPASCPVAGCLQKVTKADLEPDKDMERRLRIESKSQRSEPGDDAEEVEDEIIGETEI